MAERGSKYLLDLYRNVAMSPTLAAHSMHRLAKGKIIKFGFGQSPFPVMPSMVEALKEHAHEKYYASTQGEPPLRENISQWLLKNYGIERSPDNVIITSGSKMLFYVLQMIFSGTLFQVSPSWVSYPP